MAGTTLLSIKRRLKIVNNTRKITKAMGLVSTSKYQRARVLLYSNEKHFSSLSEIVGQVVEGIKEKDSFYFDNHGRDNKLYIICNSGKGMVGGFNTAMISRALMDMQTEKEVPFIITTGNRGMALLKKVFLDDLHSEIIPIGDLPTFKDTEELFDHTLGLYKNGYVNEVNLYFTDYINPVRTEVRKVRLLPMDREETPGREGGENILFEYEPSADLMQEKIMEMYLKEKIYNILLKSKTSEQAIRMRAMESATKNADEILMDLGRQFNRLRQSMITQEISEIVGGSEALR